MTQVPLQVEKLSDTAVKIPVFLKAGGQKHIELSLATYAAAAHHGMTLSGYLQMFNPDVDPNYGSVFDQLCMGAGVLIHSDQVTGLSSTTFQQLEKGFSPFPGMNTVVKPDGSLNNTIAGKLLVPEIILQVMASNLSESNDDFFNGIDKMVGITENVPGDKVDQPIIDTRAPEASQSRQISQLSEPAIMLSITTGSKTFKIPTVSIGAQISDQAQAASTLDLVSLAISAQARGERLRHYENNLASMIGGDTDMNETAVASELVTVYDSSISSAGVITQKAYFSWLRSKYRLRNVDYLIMDLGSAFAVDNRTGRPTISTDPSTGRQLNVNESIMNVNVKVPNVLLVDTDVIGANTIVGLDSRYAIRRVRNISASYQAIEQNVLRRATSLRIDYGEMMHKLFSEAWQKLILSNV